MGDYFIYILQSIILIRHLKFRFIILTFNKELAKFISQNTLQLPEFHLLKINFHHLNQFYFYLPFHLIKTYHQFQLMHHC